MEARASAKFLRGSPQKARLVIDMNSGRATVDGNAVGGPTTAASGGRVTGHFTVPKRAQATTTPPASGTNPPK